VADMTHAVLSTSESQPYVILHEDAFDAYFEPYRHPAATSNIWNDLGLTAYGKDWETLKTVHVVNRVCYLVTRKPHLFLPFEFKSAWRPTFLTPLGLLRQVNKIKRTFTTNNIAI